MNGRSSVTIRPQVSQIGNRPALRVPGIRRTVTDTCTGHLHTDDRASTPIRVPPRLTAAPSYAAGPATFNTQP